MNLKDFYEKIITFDKYIEFRIMNIETGKMFSIFASDIDQVLDIYDKYDIYPYNIYYGINTRPEKVKLEIDIPIKKYFYFDIEHASQKPPLTNEAYLKELKETVHYVIYNMHKKYSIKPCMLISSGRGLHLYYSCYPLAIHENDYNKKFKRWFKQEQTELEKKKPYAHLKLKDSVFDNGRIAGAPFAHHNKYPEKPLREILEINPENICDLRNILDNFKMPEFKIDKSVIASGKNRLYNEKTIFNAPEFKVFECKIPEMKGYNVHSRLRVALILLMDKYAIQNREEVARRIESLGYWYEPMTPIENPDYAYTENILLNWCLDNWQLCLEKEFKLPYLLFKNKAYKFIEKTEEVEYPSTPLSSPWDIYYFAKAFNNQTAKSLGDDRTAFYTTALRTHVFKNISDDDLGNKLKKWIEMNDFIEKIKVVR